MVYHEIHFVLREGAGKSVTTMVKTQDNVNLITKSWKDHCDTGQPTYLEVNTHDRGKTYTYKVIFRLSSMAALYVKPNISTIKKKAASKKKAR